MYVFYDGCAMILDVNFLLFWLQRNQMILHIWWFVLYIIIYNILLKSLSILILQYIELYPRNLDIFYKPKC